MIAFILFAFVVAVNGVKMEPYYHQPYRHGYTIKDMEGYQYHQEAEKGARMAEGNYGFMDNKGLRRHVKHVSDHAGYMDKIKNNEPGYAKNNPSAVRMLNDPYAHRGTVPYASRDNNPNAPSLYGYDSVYGYNTYEGRKVYRPAYYAPAYEREYVAPVQQYRPVAPMYGDDQMAPTRDGYAYNNLFAKYYEKSPMYKPSYMDEYDD